MKQRRRISLHVPCDLYDWLNETATEECRSLNQQITKILQEAKEKNEAGR